MTHGCHGRWVGLEVVLSLADWLVRHQSGKPTHPNDSLDVGYMTLRSLSTGMFDDGLLTVASSLSHSRGLAPFCGLGRQAPGRLKSTRQARKHTDTVKLWRRRDLLAANLGWQDHGLKTGHGDLIANASMHDF